MKHRREKERSRTRSRRRRWSYLAAALAVALVVSACGRDDDDAAGDGERGAPGEVPGFDGETITVGAVTPQTGIAQIVGLPLTAGNQVYFDALNAEGGIAGEYQVALEVADSQYTEDVGVQAYNGIKNDVVMIAQLLGTPITNAVLPLLEQDNIVAAPASLDAEWVPQQQLLPIGGPYQIEAINAMDYFVNELDGAGQTVCVAHQDDPYGEAGLEGIEFAAEQLDFEVGTVVAFDATAQDYTAQLQELRGANCDAVFLVSLPTTTIRMLGAAAADGYEVQWIGQAPTWVGLLAEGDLAPYLQENFLLVSEGTEWGDTSVPGMAQMLEDVQEFLPDQEPDIYFAFGYAQAWAVTQVLEEAVERGDLSREGIVDAMNDVGTLEFGGLLGDYEYGPPDDRQPPTTSTIFAVNPEKPGGLEALQKNFSSGAAEEFEFEFE